MFQDTEYKEEYHAPWCLQWIVFYSILLFNDFFLQSKKMANIFKVKIKPYFPRFSSTIFFILNSSAFYYTEYNKPLFYKQCMLSVLIFWH